MEIDYPFDPPIRNNPKINTCIPSPGDIKDAEGTLCTICQGGFKTGQKVSKTIWQHFFHADCLEHWLEDSEICPLCRKDLTNNEASQNHQSIIFIHFL